MLPVLHLDDHFVAVHKPAGMLVHRGMGAQAGETFLLQALRDQVGQYLYPVHRIDRPTCGIVVFGLDPQAAHALQTAWQDGRVRKTYEAVVRGWMPEPQGLREEALDDPDSGILHEARSRWSEIERLRLPIPLERHPEVRLSLLELEPLTGRWHQLRRHMARMGHPIAGDTTHGDRHVNHFLRDRFGWWGLVLWARRLALPHPAHGGEIVLEDSPERGLLPLWERLRSASREDGKPPEPVQDLTGA